MISNRLYDSKLKRRKFYNIILSIAECRRKTVANKKHTEK